MRDDSARNKFFLWNEALTFGSFSVVGLLATIIHIGIASAAVGFLNISPYLANGIGFLIAISISFVGQHYLTFRSQKKVSVTIKRFLLVTGASFIVSNFALAGLVRLNVMSEPLSVALAASVIPIINYFLYRHWVF